MCADTLASEIYKSAKEELEAMRLKAAERDLAASVPGTRAALAEGQRVLYGAAFERGGLIGRLDLLVARGAPSGAKPTWSLTRVTSASSITPVPSGSTSAIISSTWGLESGSLESLGVYSSRATRFGSVNLLTRLGVYSLGV